MCAVVGVNLSLSLILCDGGLNSRGYFIILCGSAVTSSILFNQFFQVFIYLVDLLYFWYCISIYHILIFNFMHYTLIVLYAEGQ